MLYVPSPALCQLGRWLLGAMGGGEAGEGEARGQATLCMPILPATAAACCTAPLLARQPTVDAQIAAGREVQFFLQQTYSFAWRLGMPSACTQVDKYFLRQLKMDGMPCQ